MSTKVPCGGFEFNDDDFILVDDVLTLNKNNPDGNGPLTQSDGDDRYIMQNDGSGYGTTTLQSLVVTEEASVQDMAVGGTITMNETNIKNLANPVDAMDAVNKDYIDNLKATVDTLGLVKAVTFGSPNDVTNENAGSMLQLLISALINTGILIET